MKKIKFSLILLSTSLFSADINGLTSVNLTAGEQKQDTLLSTKANALSDVYTTTISNPFTLSGPSDASYTISSANTATTVYFSGVTTVDTGAVLNLKDFHTLAYENGGITVNENAIFNADLSNNIINPTNTDYGGAAKVLFARANNVTTFGAKLELKQGAKANFTKAKFFISDWDINLDQGSQLNIQADTIRIQKSLNNNAAQVSLQGDVYNIGGNIGGATTSISTIENTNDGRIIVEGNFYNGGQARVDTSGSVAGGFNAFDPGFGGGGDLILRGGSMEVKGKFISQRGGDLLNSGNLLQPKNSQIELYGATLKVGGGLENKTGSSLTFGIHNDIMGKLDGDLNNNGGVVYVDVNGAKEQDYQIWTGQATGVKSIQLKNPNNFVSLSCQDGVLKVSKAMAGSNQTNFTCITSVPTTPTQPTDPTNPVTPSDTPNTPSQPAVSKYDEWKNELSNSSANVVGFLEKKYGGEIFTLGSSQELNTLVNDIQTSTTNYVSEPAKIFSAFKADTTISNPVNPSFSSQSIAASELIVLDNGASLIPYEIDPKKNFYLNGFGGVLKGNSIDGYLAGFNLGFNHLLEDNLFQMQFSYAYANNDQDLATQSATTRSKLFAFALFDKMIFDAYESEFKASALAGKFDVQRQYSTTLLNYSKADFNAYQINLGANIGYRFGERISFKPYVGLEHYLDIQDSFSENGGLGLHSKGYTHYLLALALGAEMKYEFDTMFYYAKAHYENKLYKSHKSIFFEFDGGTKLRYANEYDNTLTLSLGTQIFTYDKLKFNIEALYRYYSSGMNFYGGNFLVKYSF